MVGDQIGDMVNRIKNAGTSGKDSVSVSFSKMKLAVAETLKKEGFLSSIEVVGGENGSVHKYLRLGIVYKSRGGALIGKKEPKIEGAERVSKLSRRIYSSIGEIGKVRGGKGIYVLSTSKGVMSDKTARTEKVGGEVLLKIW